MLLCSSSNRTDCTLPPGPLYRNCAQIRLAACSRRTFIIIVFVVNWPNNRQRVATEFDDVAAPKMHDANDLVKKLINDLKDAQADSDGRQLPLVETTTLSSLSKQLRNRLKEYFLFGFVQNEHILVP